MPAFADVVFKPVGKPDRTAVEIKVYRWRTNWSVHAKQAASYLERIVADGGFQSGILIVTLDLTEFEPGSDKLVLPPNIEVWDLKKLESLSANHDNLTREFQELVAETSLDELYPLRSRAIEIESGARIAN